MRVHGVGKIEDLFAGAGISDPTPAPPTLQALQSVDALLAGAEQGLVFANLIETDQVMATARTSMASIGRCARSTPTSLLCCPGCAPATC